MKASSPRKRVLVSILFFILAMLWILVGWLIDGGTHIVGRGFILAGILGLVLTLLYFFLYPKIGRPNEHGETQQMRQSRSMPKDE